MALAEAQDAARSRELDHTAAKRAFFRIQVSA